MPRSQLAGEPGAPPVSEPASVCAEGRVGAEEGFRYVSVRLNRPSGEWCGTLPPTTGTVTGSR